MQTNTAEKIEPKPLRLTIESKHLLSCAYAMSDEQTRYYLCGVYVQPGIDGYKFTATDGHMMVQTKQSVMGENLPLEFKGFIIPSDAVHKINKAVKSFKKETVSVIITETAYNKYTATITGYDPNDTQSIGFTAIDGTFPDTERVKPRPHEDKDGVSEIGFNGDYIGELAKSAKAFTGHKTAALKFRFIDASMPCEVKCSDSDWSAILMPMRV